VPKEKSALSAIYPAVGAATAVRSSAEGLGEVHTVAAETSASAFRASVSMLSSSWTDPISGIMISGCGFVSILIS
jgi:hypothetical protein